LMGHTVVIDSTIRFLEEGRFRADSPAQPIPVKESDPSK